MAGTNRIEHEAARPAASTPHPQPAIPLVYARLVAVMAIWGGYFVVAKVSVGETSPLAVAAGRYLIGGTVLAAIAFASPAYRVRPSRSQFALIGVMAVTGIFGFNVAAMVGLSHAPASDAAMIQPTMPTVFTGLLALVLFGERITRLQTAGVAVTLAGEALIFSSTLAGESFSSERLAGDLLFLAAALLWSVYTVTARALGDGLPALTATAWTMLAGLALLLPAGAPSLWRVAHDGIGISLAAQFLYLGIFSTFIGQLWWFEGIIRIGATRAALVNTLVPVFALALAAIFLGDRPGPARLTGAAIVLAGVILANTRTRPALRPAPVEPPLREPG